MACLLAGRGRPSCPSQLPSSGGPSWRGEAGQGWTPETCLAPSSFLQGNFLEEQNSPSRNILSCSQSHTVQGHPCPPASSVLEVRALVCPEAFLRAYLLSSIFSSIPSTKGGGQSSQESPGVPAVDFTLFFTHSVSWVFLCQRPSMCQVLF